MTSTTLQILTKERAEELKTLLRNSRKIVLTCHQNPDGDALGSVLGFAEFLREMGKVPIVVLPDQYPDFFKWMPTLEKAIRFDRSPNLAKDQMMSADLLICLDFGEYSRCDDMGETLKESQATKLVFDHHESPTIETDWMISHPELSSTCELVLRCLLDMEERERLTKRIATCFYCGMMTDTGGFTYSSSRPEIYELIGILLTYGIDKDKIYRNVFNNFSINKMKFWGFVLSEKLHYIESKGVAYFAVSKKELETYHYIKGFTEGLVNMPLQIKGCKLSISLREDTKLDNKVWVSLRSVDDMNCIKIAERYFNGGGHLNAAGGQLHCSLAEAEEIVRQLILGL